MSTIAAGETLLAELDARQDQLLLELDALNARIEQAIADCLAWREATCAPAPLPKAA